jgi:hypothetical protein
MTVRWFDDCGRGAGSGSGPVGTHRLGNNDALPAVVTYFCPAGEVQMTVPTAIVLRHRFGTPAVAR